VEGLTWANVVSLLVGALSLAGVVTVAVLQRRSERDKVTKDLTVVSETTKLETNKLEMSDRQFQSRWEERLEEFTKMQGENYAALLDRAGEANERLLAEVQHQGAEIKELRAQVAGLETAAAEIPRLRQQLAECESRDALRDVADKHRETRMQRMAAEIRRLGGNAEC
jgi:hypothetical protein